MTTPRIIIAMIVSVLILSIMLLGWYRFKNCHLRGVTVDDCERAAAPCIKRLSRLVDESWFNRPFYEVTANNYTGPCLFFKYEKGPETLYVGYETTSGVVVGTHMTQDQMRHFADTLNPATNTEQVISYIRILHDKHPPLKTERKTEVM